MDASPGRSVAAAFLLLALVAAVPGDAQLTRVGSQFWDQDSPGVEGEAEPGDRFGSALVVGDFNDDSFADLAIGVPSEDVAFDCDDDGDAEEDECANAGAVAILYGSVLGLDVSAETLDQLFTQATAGVPGNPEPNDHFGETLGVFSLGLAVGVPDEDVTVLGVTHADAGAVNFFSTDLGAAAGLHPDGIAIQGQDGVPGTPESGDHFGTAIASGPSDRMCTGTRHYTLAISAPGESHTPAGTDQGVIAILVDPCGEQDDDGLPNLFDCPAFDGCYELRQGEGVFDGTTAEDGDLFGHALLEFSGIGLAIGVRGENSGAATDGAGAAQVVDENFSGSATYNFANCLPGAAAADDRLGTSLAAGDFNGDFDEDLAMGAPGRIVGGDDGAGAVGIVYASAGDLLPNCAGSEVFDQDDIAGIAAESSDHFGENLAAGDFDGDGVDDLAIGVPDENVGSQADAGLVNVLYGNATGLGVAGVQTFDLDDEDLVGDAQPGDRFGAALAAGDFNNDGLDDLAIGVPGSVCSGDDCGGVYVLYGGVDEDHQDAADFTVTGTTCGPQSFSEGVDKITVTVTRSGNPMQALNVNIGDLPVESTATVGSDFVDPDISLHWDVGEVGARTFQVDLNPDAVDEPNETIVLNLDAPSRTREPGPFTITLCDNETDVAGTLQFSDDAVTRGELAVGTTVRVDRIGGTLPVTIPYSTTNVTATAGSDYTATNGTLSFAQDELFKTFPVPILDDTIDEPTETFTVDLGTPSAGTRGTPSTQTVTISDNEVNVPGSFRFSSAAGQSRTEDVGATFTLTVERINGTLANVAVSYATAAGTATAGADYVTTSGTLTFAVNELTKTFQVPILDDAADEPSESLTVSLSSPTGGATLTSPTSRTLTINDDDPGPAIFDDGFESGTIVWDGSAP